MIFLAATRAYRIATLILLGAALLPMRAIVA